MASSNSLIEARQAAYYEAMKSGSIDGILALMSDDVDYSDISFNILNMAKPAFTAFVTQFYSGMESMSITSVSVSGSEDFVAWEWVMEFVSKEDNPAFGVVKGKSTVLNGVSLVWWKNEGKEGEGYKGWKVVRAKDYSSVAVAH